MAAPTVISDRHPGAGGCQWLNPFSNGIPGAPNRGLTNPGFVSSLANTAALADWIMPIQTGETEFQEYELNAVLSGTLPWTLPGGSAKWAGGFQWRHNSFKTDYSQFGNEIISPCSDSVPPVGLNNCIFPSNPNPAVTTGTGPNVFGPVSIPVDISQTSMPASASSTCRSPTASSSNWPPGTKTTAGSAATPSTRRPASGGRRTNGWPSGARSVAPSGRRRRAR